MTIPITFEYGLVLRKSSLRAKSIKLATILSAAEVLEATAEDEDLIHLGPFFGGEACEAISKKLIELGLAFWDDFFALELDHPIWLRFSARHE